MLVSCGTVKVNNQEWCGDFGELGAECFYTQSSETRIVEKPQWDEERFGQLCAKPDVFADMKRTILQLCKAYKKCVYDNRTNSISYYQDKKKVTVYIFDHVEKFSTEIKKMKGE